MDEKSLDTRYVGLNCGGALNLNFISNVAFSLGAGPQRASENVACNPKIRTHFLYVTFLKVLRFS